MWRDILPPLADAGFYAIAPDLAGFGDSEADPPGTWERQVEALERFRTAQELGQVSARRPRLGRADRPALGLRPPGGGQRARHLRHRLLPRRPVARPRRRDALRGQGEGFVDGDRARKVRGDAREPQRDHARRRASTSRRSPTRRAAAASSSSTARATSRSSCPTRASWAALGVPTLMLWGADDFAPPAAAAIASSARSPAPSSSCSRAPATSWSTTRRQRYAEALVGFLKRARPGTPR